MEQRAYVTKAELDSKIQSVKIDISKGPQNQLIVGFVNWTTLSLALMKGVVFTKGKKQHQQI